MKNETLVGANPAEVLPHGETKRLVDHYLFHAPTVGVVASYMPKERDVLDHFGVFRGVDMVESFGQAAVVSTSVFLDAIKTNVDYKTYYQNRNFVFVGVEKVHCHGFIRCGEPYVCLGVINHYKFRQMTVSGRIYKTTPDIDLGEYFSHFTEERLRNYDVDDRFTMVFEIQNIVGQGIRNDKFQI